MELFQRVVIGVDIAGSDMDLVRYSRVLRRLSTDVECHFIHVLGWPGRLAAGKAPLTHREALRQLEAGVAEHYGAGRVVCRVTLGNVIDSLLETALQTRAGLIMVGHRRDHQRRRALARRLAMKAPCSVWMRPEGSTSDIQRVLAAVDYSMPSAQALSVATRIAQSTDRVECLVLHAFFSGGIAGGERNMERSAERDNMARFLAPLDTHGVRLTPLIEESANIVRAVQQAAEREQADLIVMGNRGQSASASILLGGESEHMLMEATVPVLIVKRQGERVSLLHALLDREFHVPEAPRFG